MIILKNYEIIARNGCYYVVTDEKRSCPLCGGRLKVRDSRERKLVRDDGRKECFHLRRLKCLSCGAVHLELPDIMVPYHRYDRMSIEGAINESRMDCPADDATIYRWKHSGLMKGEKKHDKDRDGGSDSQLCGVAAAAGDQGTKH